MRSLHSEREGRAKKSVTCHMLSFERGLGTYWASEKHLSKKQMWQDPEGRGVPVQAVLQCKWWEHPNRQTAASALSALRVLQDWRLHLSQLPRKWPGNKTQTKVLGELWGERKSKELKDLPRGAVLIRKSHAPEKPCQPKTCGKQDICENI